MNFRKPVDYDVLYAELNQAMQSRRSQMELYYEIARLVSERPEKGAAVAASEYLISKYPDATGFSPRNLRRMRDFYRAYQGKEFVLRDALQLGWTQNIVILEAELTMEERHWYIRAAKYFEWSKAELLQQIKECAHEKTALDKRKPGCYTQNEKQKPEYKRVADTFCLSRQYLKKSDSRGCYVGSDEESRFGAGLPDQVGGHQYRRDWQSGLPAIPPLDCRAWHRLLQQKDRRLLSRDYVRCDLLLGMDRTNLRNMHWIRIVDFADIIYHLIDVASRLDEVTDSWYTGEFDTTWRDVEGSGQGVPLFSCLKDIRY